MAFLNSVSAEPYVGVGAEPTWLLTLSQAEVLRSERANGRYCCRNYIRANETAMVGGSAVVGFVYPEKKEYAIMSGPAACVALWACVWGPLGRTTGGKAVVVQVATVLGILLFGARD